MTVPLFAGIDGGGTKTAIVVVDAQGIPVFRGQTSTSNAAVIGHERAAEILHQLMLSAASACNTDLPFTTAWFGLSGSDRPEDHRILRPWLADTATEMMMTNDAELALGSLPDRVGVAIVAGTGSICFGQNSEGVHARAGGWGHTFSDEGSGYGIAVQALRAFAAQHDGLGPETSLTSRLMEHWEIEDPFSIITRVYDPETAKGDIALLSKMVVEEGGKGDTVSLQIMEQGAECLAAYGTSVARRLDLGPELALAFVGGMLVPVKPYRERVLHLLREHWVIPEVTLVEDPALSAAQSLAQTYRSAAS